MNPFHYYFLYIEYWYQSFRQKRKAASPRYSGQIVLAPAHPDEIRSIRNTERAEQIGKLLREQVLLTVKSQNNKLNITQATLDEGEDRVIQSATEMTKIYEK